MIPSLRAHSGSLIVAITVVVISLVLSVDAVREWGLYSRDAAAQGEWWRFLTAQFTHLNTPHLILNVSAWILIWIYGWQTCTAGTWLWLIISTTALTGLTLHYFEPDVYWHGGLSGILHGFLLSVAVLKLRSNIRDWNAGLALIAVIGKLVWEWHNGAMPGTEDLVGEPVLTAAHLHGALTGLLATLLLLTWQTLSRGNARVIR